MKKYVLKKIILSGVFISLSFLLMVITFPLMGLKPFPTRFYIDLIYLLTICIICFVLPILVQETIQIMMLLFEFVILFAGVGLYKSRGDIFNWEFLTQINQLGAVKDMIVIPVWLIFVGIGILAIYIVTAILIKIKDVDVKKFYSWLSVGIATISLVVCSSLNIVVHKQIDHNYKDESYYCSDAFLFDSHLSSFACLQKFGYYGYYMESFFRYMLPFIQPEIKTFAYDYENYTSILNGLCEDNNVIMIYAESFDIFGISKELTPTLYAMKNGANLTSSGISEFYNISKENGKTTISRKDFDYNDSTDSYVFNATDIYQNIIFEQVGLNLSNYQSNELTNVSEAKALTGNYTSFSYSIPKLLGEDYKTNYIHGHKKSFYHRDTNMPAFGFDNSYFIEDMQDFFIGNYSDDLNCVSLDSETMRYCTDNPARFNLFPTDEKFFTFFMTVTTHGGYDTNNLLNNNYNFIDSVANSDICGEMFNLYNSLDDELKSVVKEYFARVLDTEFAVSYIVNYLHENNLLDKTIITFTGDHDAYSNNLGDFKSKYVEEVLHKDKYSLNHNVEAFIYATNITNAFLQENSEVRNVEEHTESVDLLPTILTLLDVDYTQEMFMGSAVINKSVSNPDNSVHNKVLLSFKYIEVTSSNLSSKDGNTIQTNNPNFTPTQEEIEQFKKDYNEIYQKYYYTKSKQ